MSEKEDSIENNTNKPSLVNEVIEEEKISEIKSEVNLPSEEEVSGFRKSLTKSERPSITSASTKMSVDPNTLIDAFSERRRKNYTAVKHWDENRIKVVRLHRSTVDHILEQIDKKVRSSKMSLEVILKYFNDVCERETEGIKFVKIKLSKVGSAYFNPENPKELVYPKLSKALSVIDDAQASRLKYLEDFLAFISKTILKDTFGVEIIEYEKAVSIFKSTIAALKKSLFKVNSEIAVICAKFTKNQDSSGSKKKDLYGIQLSFFSKVQNHFSILRQIAKEAYSFLSKIIDLEKRRKDSICKAFHLYLSKGNEVYGKSFLSEMAAKHFDSMQMDSEVDSHFDLNSFIPISVFNEISEVTGQQVNDTKSLKIFLEEYQFDEIREKLLVLKQVHCLKDIGGITRNFKQISVIVTIDKNLLLVDNSKLDDVKILNYLDLSKVTIHDRNDPSQIELHEKNPGIFFDSTSKVVLKFENADNLMEIRNYIETLKNMIGV